MKSIIAFTLVALTAPTFADTYVVEAHSMTFVPDVITVQPGDVIRWEYVTGYPHDVTSGIKCSHDGYLYLDIPSGGFVEWTVPEDAPSEVPYFCELHCGNGMTGIINIDEVPDPLVDLRIGIIDIDCYFHYTKSADGAVQVHFSELWNDKVSRASFAWGMEVADVEDVEIQISAATADGGELFVHRTSDGSETALVTGPMTLYAGEKYLFHGSCNFYGEFSVDIEWIEEYAGDEQGFIIVDVEGDGSLNATDDNFMLRASNDQSATFTFDALVDLELPLTVIADVSSSTLTMPASGEDVNVVVTAGTHTINVGSTSEGILLMRFDSGDDGGGSMPQDVNGDCVVDVSDLLEIISAWGSTCP